MSVNVATLEATLTANAAQFHRALQGAESSANRFGKTIGTIGRIGARAFVAVGVAAAGVVGTGLKVAMDMEQAQIGFEQMLGSAQKATSFMKELQNFAAKTPFEFPELRSAAGKFLGVGVEAAKVIPIMTSLGDSIAAVGGGQEQISRATTALVQMQMKGKVTGEEMLQLAEAGVNAWGALAAKLGVDVPTAQEMVSKGAVKVNDLYAAIAEKAGPLGRVAGMMDKQSQSLRGLLSTLKDTVSLNLASMATPLVEGIKNALPGFTEAIDSVMASVGPMLTTFTTEIVDTLGTLLPALMPIVGQLSTVFGQVLQSAQPILTLLGTTLASTIEQILPALQPLIQALGQGLLQALQALAPHLPVLATSMAEILVAITPLIPVFADLATILIEVAAPAFIFLAEHAVSQVQSTVAAIQTLMPVVGTVVGFIVDKFLAMAEWILRAAAKALGWIPGWGPKIREAATAVEQMRDRVGAAFESIVNNSQRVNGVRFSDIIAQYQALGRSADAAADAAYRVARATNSSGVYNPVSGPRHYGGPIMHTGGFIPPKPGEVDIRAERGEFLVQDRAVRLLGTDFMRMVNRGIAPAMPVPVAAGGGGIMNVTVYVTAHDVDEAVAKFRTELHRIERQNGRR